MLSIAAFEDLLNSPESSLLDFKETMYNLTENGDQHATAKLVKDVISFSNTIRNETSYIIVGVGQDQDGSMKLVGINEVIDDAILQDKVKDKMHPRPKFLFYTLKYKALQFGVFEFPVYKYPLPISTIVKMKGLETGKVYYRSGTSNSEASGHDIVAISRWLDGLPIISEHGSLFDKTTSLLKKLSTGKEKLSEVIVEVWQLAKLFNLESLAIFCSCEIQGYDGGFDTTSEAFKFRAQTIKCAPFDIKVNYVTRDELKRHIDSNADFFDLNMFFPYPISRVEELLDKFERRPSTVCTTVNFTAKQIFPNWTGKDVKLWGYIFEPTLSNLYRNVRQKAIDELMKIK